MVTEYKIKIMRTKNEKKQMKARGNMHLSFSVIIVLIDRVRTTGFFFFCNIFFVQYCTQCCTMFQRLKWRQLAREIARCKMPETRCKMPET